MRGLARRPTAAQHALRPGMRPAAFFLATVFLLLMAGATPARAQMDIHDERYVPEIVTVESPITEDRVYIVEEGDTLWDICEMFFNDPWYWPTLWAYNPQITNPHWIFPGDYIHVRPRFFEYEQVEQVTWTGSRYATDPRDVTFLARRKGFLPKEHHHEAGVIEASREERMLLGAMDEIYVRFSTVRTIRPDQEYTIYRVEQEVSHPVTRRALGYRVRFLGTLNVLSADKPLAGGVITKAYEEIERGDLVTPVFEQVSRLSPRENEVDLEGVIAAYFAEGTMAGEHDYVFIDLGREHGVQRGNRLVIETRGDPTKRRMRERDLEDFQWERVGELMIVEPHETTSLGVLTRSIHEVPIGTRVKMIKGY